VLDAAERQFDTASGAVIVDEYLTAPDGARHPQLASAVARPHAATRPKSVALAMRIASASSVNGIAASTGPKTSSHAMREVDGTSRSSAGSM
jgi:hypothetical protein